MAVTMTMRERLLALVRGDEVDRVPFVQYHDLAAPDEEVWSVVGRQELGILQWTMPWRREQRACRSHTEAIERDGLEGQRTTIDTPVGSIWEERFFEPTYRSAWIGRHFIQEPADYDVLTAWLDDQVIVAEPDTLAAVRRDLGDDGLPHVRVERTPYQQLWVQWVGVDDLVLHMADEPDRVGRCIEALDRRQRDVFRVVAAMDVDYVDVPDNLTAPVIGEAWFRQYCLPAYDELAECMGEDRPVFVHMDGDLAPLAEAIAGSRVRGIDSLSPPPDNDTSPGVALAWHPEMRVGINFPSSVHLAAPEVVYETTRAFLDEAGASGRFQIQISENVPPFAWRTSFPQIIRAIHDDHG